MHCIEEADSHVEMLVVVRWQRNFKLSKETERLALQFPVPVVGVALS